MWKFRIYFNFKIQMVGHVLCLTWIFIVGATLCGRPKRCRYINQPKENKFIQTTRTITNSEIGKKFREKPVDIRTKPIYNRYTIKMSKDTQSRKIKEFFGSEIRIIALKGDKGFIIFLQKVPKTSFLSGFWHISYITLNFVGIL